MFPYKAPLSKFCSLQEYIAHHGIVCTCRLASQRESFHHSRHEHNCSIQVAYRAWGRRGHQAWQEIVESPGYDAQVYTEVGSNREYTWLPGVGLVGEALCRSSALT